MADQVSKQTPTGEIATNLIHSALVRALLWQVFLALIATLILDSGVFLRMFAGASAGYWLIGIVVLVIRPGGWGLMYLRHGVWVVFVLVLAIDSIWHEKVVDLVGRR